MTAEPTYVFTNSPTAAASLASTFRLPPLFPCSVNVCGVQITLKADGGWEGSLPAFRQAMADATGIPDGTTQLLLWLVLREMERDARQW